jgi:hypothetical protein
MWYGERKSKSRNQVIPKFQQCCHGGKAQLPMMKEPPPLLQHLMCGREHADSQNFQSHVRIYNSMFAFTSPGMQLDSHIKKGRGPPTIRIQGQICHRIGSMLPVEGQGPKFAQLYIYDTENEVKNRMHIFRSL